MASKFSESFSKGHEEFIERHCTQCEEIGRNETTSWFCMDCNEYYCDVCVKTHRRIPCLQSHGVLSMAEKERHDLRHNELAVELKRQTQHNERLQKEVAATKDTLSNTTAKVQTLEEEKDSHEKKLSELKEEYVRVSLERQSLEKENLVLKNRCKENDIRFSKAAADEMQQNKPNVADLGVKYRPMDIAEKYRQLYDAPWTSAYRALRNESGDDKGNVKLLLETLMDIYNYCKKLADGQETKLKHYIQFPVQDCTAQIKMKEIEDRQRHALLDLRKQVVVGLHQEVFEGYFNDKKKKQADGNEVRLSKPVMEKMKPYWQKCVEVCWPMVVHNPPLTLHDAVKAGDPVDEKIYNLRSDGDIVDTLVWPPLYVGEREALLAKGVVEAKKTMTRV